MTNKTAADT